MNTATLPISKTVEDIIHGISKGDTIEVETHWGGFVTWSFENENVTAHGSAFIRINNYGEGEFRRDAIVAMNDEVESLAAYDDNGDKIELSEEEDRLMKMAVRDLIVYI